MSQMSRVQPYKHYRELTKFESELDFEIADGKFDDLITVHDPNGNYHIVAALAKEELYYLNERVSSCGGYADIFVSDGARVHVLHAQKANKAPSQAEDFTELRTGASTVGTFIDYLKRRPNGVCIPSSLERGSGDNLSVNSDTVVTCLRDFAMA